MLYSVLVMLQNVANVLHRLEAEAKVHERCSYIMLFCGVSAVFARLNSPLLSGSRSLYLTVVSSGRTRGRNI
jgi:hypothetical protein